MSYHNDILGVHPAGEEHSPEKEDPSPYQRTISYKFNSMKDYDLTIFQNLATLEIY
jgi:hypothetical protein